MDLPSILSLIAIAAMLPFLGLAIICNLCKDSCKKNGNTEDGEDVLPRNAA